MLVVQLQLLHHQLQGQHLAITTAAIRYHSCVAAAVRRQHIGRLQLHDAGLVAPDAHAADGQIDGYAARRRDVDGRPVLDEVQSNVFEQNLGGGGMVG